MCLAQPLQLVEIDSEHSIGKVTFNGITLSVGLDLVPEAKVGSFVLVHAGMAIELLENDDAQAIRESLELFIHDKTRCFPGGNKQL